MSAFCFLASLHVLFCFEFAHLQFPKVLEKIGDSELFNEELKGLMFNQLDGFLFSERGKLNLEELVSRVVDSL